MQCERSAPKHTKASPCWMMLVGKVHSWNDDTEMIPLWCFVEWVLATVHEMSQGDNTTRRTRQRRAFGAMMQLFIVRSAQVYLYRRVYTYSCILIIIRFQTPQTPVNMHNHIEIYERIHNIHIVSVYAHDIKNHNIMNIHWRIIRLRRGFWRMLRVPVLYIKNDVETIWSVPALFCIRPCNVERGRLGCAIA